MNCIAAFSLIVLSAVICTVHAVPVSGGRNSAGMMFYHQRPVYYTPKYYPSQQAMLVHYGEPSQYASRRSAPASGVYAAGDTIGGETFIQGNKHYI